MSSENPFSDPAPEQNGLAPALAHSTAPEVTRDPQPVEARRTSVNSFVVGDDSFEAETIEHLPSQHNTDALSPRTLDPSHFDHSVLATGESSESPAAEAADESADQDGQPGRSKSIMVASDNWAARKAQLKNNLALRSNPTSPSADQGPFADPAPMLDNEFAALSPMNLEFPKQ